MPLQTELLEIFMRLGAAVICGAMLGLDREIKHKNVGIRTIILVCLGSAAFSIIVTEMVNYYSNAYNDISPDPTRTVQGIITGIGFLGGGAIMQAKGQVTGTATGASIWICGAIGVACGYGFYSIAFVVTFYAVIVLVVIGFLRAKLRQDLENDTGKVPNNKS